MHQFWKSIESICDFQLAIENSIKEKVVIFKHSTRCIKMVFKNFENEIAQEGSDHVSVCGYSKVAISKHFTVNQVETLIEAQNLI